MIDKDTVRTMMIDDMPLHGEMILEA